MIVGTSPSMSVMTINVNGLNSPVKKQRTGGISFFKSRLMNGKK